MGKHKETKLQRDRLDSQNEGRGGSQRDMLLAEIREQGIAQ